MVRQTSSSPETQEEPTAVRVRLPKDIEQETEAVLLLDILNRAVAVPGYTLYRVRDPRGVIQFIGQTTQPLRNRLLNSIYTHAGWAETDDYLQGGWTVTLERMIDEAAAARRVRALVDQHQPPGNHPRRRATVTTTTKRPVGRPRRVWAVNPDAPTAPLEIDRHR